MGVWHKQDSIAELKKRKTVDELAEENEQLKEQVESLEGQLLDTQIALCDVYELVAGGGS